MVCLGNIYMDTLHKGDDDDDDDDDNNNNNSIIVYLRHDNIAKASANKNNKKQKQKQQQNRNKNNNNNINHSFNKHLIDSWGEAPSSNNSGARYNPI